MRFTMIFRDAESDELHRATLEAANLGVALRGASDIWHERGSKWAVECELIPEEPCAAGEAGDG